MKPIPNRHVQKKFGLSALDGLDGELTVGPPSAPDVFRQTSTGVMSELGCPAAVFNVFDDVFEDAAFQKRIVKLFGSFKDSLGAGVHVVPHRFVTCEDELLSAEAEYLEQGYEGAMIRSVDGPYKFGRSTVREGYLLKMKRFSDSEALVIGSREMEHNENEGVRNLAGKLERSSKKSGKVGAGVLGNLLARDIHTGVEFSVGSGLDAAEKVALWKDRDRLLGRVFTYRFFSHGVKDKPRHPVFHGWRGDLL
jgi:DNA ligase-1